MNNYIIGGGIIGKIVASLKPDYKLITDGRPDLVSAGVSPIVIHYDEQISNYIKRIYSWGARYTNSRPTVRVSKCRVEYCVADFSTTFCSEMTAADYFRKSRQLSVREESVLLEKSFAESDDSSFKFYDIDMNVFMAGLNFSVGEDRIITDRVEGLNKEVLYLHYGGLLPYDNVISTIAAPVFFDIWREECEKQEFVFRGKTILPLREWLGESFVVPSWLASGSEKGYVYYPSDKPRRVLRVNNLGKELALEVAGRYPNGMFMPLAYFIKPSKPVVPPAENIKFVGRFATWDEDVFIHHVIKQFLG